MIPHTQYAKAQGADIAYKVVGDGPRDIVLLLAFTSHLDAFLEVPENADFVERLTRLGRVILFDKRGTGLSERTLEGVTSEQLADDVISVMDAAGSTEAVLLGWLDAGAICLLAAARHPDRVKAVIAGETLAAGHPDDDHPFGIAPELVGLAVDVIRSGGWGTATLIEMILPGIAADPRKRAFYARYETMSATPRAAARLFEMNASVDLRPHLAKISAPVLLIHDLELPMVTTEGVQWLADRLPTASMILVRSPAPLTGVLPVDEVLDEVEQFLAGTRVGGSLHRQLATLLVTDIVGSSETAASTGDMTWKHVLSTHRDAVRRSLARYGGAEIDTAGDGFLSSFSLPSAALRCAADVTMQSRALGIEVRAGIHTGEVLLQPPSVIGLAVHVAARVAALAGPSEILLTDTVRSSLIGSDLEFEPAGEHTLKGIPGRWQLHRLAGQDPTRTSIR